MTTNHTFASLSQGIVYNAPRYEGELGLRHMSDLDCLMENYAFEASVQRADETLSIAQEAQSGRLYQAAADIAFVVQAAWRHLFPHAPKAA